MAVIMKGGHEMTENQKKQIDACRENGLTISAIANVTGLSVSAVKSYCSRRNNSDKPFETCCKYCGAVVTQPKSRREKHFCNQSCYFRWRYLQGDLKRTVYEKVCEYCGKPFTVESNMKQRYCSRACFHKAKKGERRG